VTTAAGWGISASTTGEVRRASSLAVLGYAALARPPANFREGVLWTESLQTDTFFVTVNKSERDYSPTTRYHDYAISPSLFHWESQNATSIDSLVGRRYLTQRESSRHVLLFARETAYYDWDKSRTRPYTCLGPATYKEHTGNKPIAITYELRHPMPIDTFRQASRSA
jgi:hypothetical protein